MENPVIGNEASKDCQQDRDERRCPPLKGKVPFTRTAPQDSFLKKPKRDKNIGSNGLRISFTRAGGLPIQETPLNGDTRKCLQLAGQNR